MDFIESPSKDKKAHLLRLLNKGGVMLFIDARQKGIQVPSHLIGNPQLPLNLDYSFQIPDFRILEDRVEATLSFNRQNFFCVIPMPCIYAIRSHLAPEVIVFPDDIPVDFTPLTPAKPTSPRVAAKRPKLITVPGKSKPKKGPEKGRIAKKSTKLNKTPKSKKKTSHLKLVKS